MSSFGTQQSQAAQSCRNSGMQIATPETQTEFNDLLKFFDTTGFQYAHETRAYIGISKVGYGWVLSDSGAAIGYSVKWFPAQPSGDGTCSEVLKEHGHLGLNDLSCGHTRHFICEKVDTPPPPVTIPPTTAAPVSIRPTTAAPVTQPPVTKAPVTTPASVDTTSNPQCEMDKQALMMKVKLISSVLQSKNAELEELLRQNQKKNAEINECRENLRSFQF